MTTQQEAIERIRLGKYERWTDRPEDQDVAVLLAAYDRGRIDALDRVRRDAQVEELDALADRFETVYTRDRDHIDFGSLVQLIRHRSAELRGAK